MQIGIPVARIELLDDVQMDACIRYSKLEGFAVQPTLFFEFHGTRGAACASRPSRCRRSATNSAAAHFQWATQPEDRTRLWKARHDAYYAALALQARA